MAAAHTLHWKLAPAIGCGMQSAKETLGIGSLVGGAIAL